MQGVVRVPPRRKPVLAFVFFLMILLSGCLGNGQQSVEESSRNDDVVLDVWHTFAAESKEEEVFMNSVAEFESAH